LQSPRDGLIWYGQRIVAVYYKSQNSELSELETRAVEQAIKESGLAGFLLQKPLIRLDFVTIQGDVHFHLASGLTLSTPYSRIIIRPIFSTAKIPMGEEDLRAGLSEGVAVIASNTAYMKCALVHELGHYIWNEAGMLIQRLIQTAFLVGNPISRYAAFDEQEYFCESLAAYVYYRHLLETHDLTGYNLVKEVLEILSREI
jgi:hypothetical protein